MATFWFAAGGYGVGVRVSKKNWVNLVARRGVFVKLLL